MFCRSKEPHNHLWRGHFSGGRLWPDHLWQGHLLSGHLWPGHLRRGRLWLGHFRRGRLWRRWLKPAAFVIACFVCAHLPFETRPAKAGEIAGETGKLGENDVENDVKNDAGTMHVRIKDIADRRNKLYRLFIAVPDFIAAPDKAPPKDGFPLIVLLDANVTFDMAKALHPDAVLLGLGYPTSEKSTIVERRFFDLTGFAKPDKIPLKDGMMAPKTGGEKDFRRFLVDDVLPMIKKDYPVNAKNITLYGHSLSGLFVMNTLLSADHGNFHTYCAADPSIWWNGHEFIATLQNYKKPDSFNPQLLIEISGLKTHHAQMSDNKKKRIADLRSGPNGQDVWQILKDRKKIEGAFFRFDDKNHGTMIAPSIHDCLAFSLDGKNPNPNQ